MESLECDAADVSGGSADFVWGDFYLVWSLKAPRALIGRTAGFKHGRLDAVIRSENVAFDHRDMGSVDWLMFLLPCDDSNRDFITVPANGRHLFTTFHSARSYFSGRWSAISTHDGGPVYHQEFNDPLGRTGAGFAGAGASTSYPPGSRSR